MRAYFPRIAALATFDGFAGDVVYSHHAFHALDRLTGEAIQRVRDERGEVTVPVSRGGAMVMRLLLLHA